LARAEELLVSGTAGQSSLPAELAGANYLALISVPGAFAAAEARKALESGMHVMMFSDKRAYRG